VQRRHQKVIEEAPSPIVTPELRKRMGDAAVRIARAGGYVNAGTVEFLVDTHYNYYFLEVNTRLQVEHPVTEQVTGLDLVKLQIAIAAGHRLRSHGNPSRRAATPCKSVCTRKIQKTISFRRLENSFAPRASGPGIRLDEGVYSGWTVPVDYDPLLAKLIAWGNSREETIARLRRALEEYSVTGIKTNTALFRRILVEPDFLRSEIHTKWLDEMLMRPHAAPDVDSRAADAAAIAAALLARFARLCFRSSSRGKIFALENGRPHASDGPYAMKYEIRIGGKPRVVELTRNSEKLKVFLDGKMLDVDAVEIATNTFSILIEGESYEVRVAPMPDGSLVLQTGLAEYVAEVDDPRRGAGVVTERWKRKDASRSLRRCRGKLCGFWCRRKMR